MRRSIALLVLATSCFHGTASAQRPPYPPTAITLRPSAGPQPALRYHLVPERRTLVPGNAAIFYHRGIQFVSQTRTSLADPKRVDPVSGIATEEQIALWLNEPLAEIPRDKVEKVLETFKQSLTEAELGATRSHCDWELDNRTEGITLMIPEIQEMRSLARLVALRARLATIDGKTDEAMHWIETGMVMGRHIAQGPILVQYLVGVAIDSLMVRGIEDLIQAPGTPSLYWALADRPRPFIDLRESLEGERYALENEFPGLLDLDRGPWGLEQARKFSGQLQKKLFAIASDTALPGDENSMPNAMPAAGRRLGVAAMSAKIYPEASRALIAQGLPKEQVEAMPVVQVAALYCYREYKRLRDETYKWMNVPYWQSYDRPKPHEMHTAEQKLANPLLTMFRLLDSPLDSIRLASLRVDRRLDALQCIEAIRLYAAAHDGKLPESLEAMKEAPAPLDIATGKPFLYKVEGDSATLSAPVPPGAPDHPLYAIRFALKLAR